MAHALNGGPHRESENLMVTDGKGEPIQSCPLTRGPSAQPRETACRTDLFLHSQVLGKRQPSCCPERLPLVGWGVRDLLVSVGLADKTKHKKQ